MVHVLSPGKHDRSLPQPSSASMTCNWDLTDGQSQLAVAARMSTALWTLHESGPSPFDCVLAASIGGPERQLKQPRPRERRHRRVARRRRRSGQDARLLVGRRRVRQPARVPLRAARASRRSPTAGSASSRARRDTPLPGAGPALQLAAAAGRIAYIPATIVQGDRPSATTNDVAPHRGRHDRSTVAQASRGARNPARDRALLPRARRPHDTGRPARPDLVVLGDRRDEARQRPGLPARGTAARRERPAHRLPRRPPAARRLHAQRPPRASSCRRGSTTSASRSRTAGSSGRRTTTTPAASARSRSARASTGAS